MSSHFVCNVYAVLAWLLAAIGVLHMATTFGLHAATPFTRIWFFGTGIAMAQCAALNLLHRTYGRSALGIRWTTRGFNIVILAFATVAGAVTGASAVELVILLGVLAAVLLLSFMSVAYKIP